MSKNTPTKKENEKTQQDKKKVAEKPSTPFWKKHFLKLFLVLLLIVSIVWGWVANNQLQKEHEEAMTELKEAHKEEITSMVKLKNKEVTQALALAVRSELIDENKDQVNQYFLQVLKQPSVSKIMLLNHDSGKVLISTNKKDEGTTFNMENLVKAKDLKTVMNEGNWYTAAPIMGLNNQLAVIVMVSSNE